MRQFEQMRETWDADALELISDFIDATDRLVVRFIWRGVGHGPEANLELTNVVTVRKGKVFGLEYFWDHAEALEAVGLSEQDAHADSWACGILRAMSQENVEVVKRAVAAVNDRDVDGYLACCTADVRMENPVAPIEGAYEGSDGIRRFFADVLDTGPDFRVTIEWLESIGTDRVLGFMRLNMSGRASGINLGSDIPSTNLYDFTDGKIKRVRIFLDRREALEAVGLSDEWKSSPV
jgi:ketosteroid isomerase-like protein